MSSKNIFKITVSVLLFIIGLWVNSLLPFVIIIFIGDSINVSPYYHRLHNLLFNKLGDRIKYAEWGIALLFSIWLAFFIRVNFMEVYRFTTSSMQSEIKPGDFVLVNKLIPGKRLHEDNINHFKRCFGFGTLERKDIIVFNFPEADTLLADNPTESYYYMKRLYKSGKTTNIDFSNKQFLEVAERPRVVSRIYGIPGDSIKIERGLFYVNGKLITYPDSSLGAYVVKDKTAALNSGIKPYDSYNTGSNLVWEMLEVNYNKSKKKMPWLMPDLNMRNYPEVMTFPYNTHLLWNKDYYGSLYIPKKGDTIKLTENNISIYKRIIETYEQNTFRVIDGVSYINGKVLNTYTFKMDYYWVQGDNRPHSYDSRYWGFVPDNHIIGKVSEVVGI